MAVTVRRATRNDASAIARLAVALFEMHVKWDERRFTQIATTDGAERFYAERSEAENAAIFVAEDGEGLHGFAYMEYSPVLYAELAARVVWLHDIYVETDARGSGVGGSLLEALKAEAKELGAAKILLAVAANNMDGQRFFSETGFRTTMHEMMLDIDNNV